MIERAASLENPPFSEVIQAMHIFEFRNDGSALREHTAAMAD
jgi:hypothetical protein